MVDGLGDRVKVEREAKTRPDGKKWAQADLAAEVTRLGFPITQPGIGNIESGKTKKPMCISELARALAVEVSWLRTGRGPKHAPQFQSAVHTFEMGAIQKASFNSREVSASLMWRSSLGEGIEQGGFMLNAKRGRSVPRPAYLADDDKAFCFKVIGRENEPVYRLRDRLWVNPDEPLDEGEDCLFLKDPDNIEGGHAIIARLVRIADRLWTIVQHADRSERAISRREWKHAWVIVGRERHR